TPPPSPPMATIAILIGCAADIADTCSEVEAGARALAARLQPADHAAAQPFAPAVAAVGVFDDARLVERRAQHRGVRGLAAQAAANAAVEHRRHRVGAQRIRIRPDRQRRAARQPDARMIAGAGVGVDAEALANDALASGDRLAHQRTLAPLAVQHALGLRDQHLRPLLRRGQRLLQRAAHAVDVVGAPDRPDPLDADAANRVLDLVPGAAGTVLGARRWNVLAAGRRGVVVLDHDGDVVALVEH